MLVVTGGVALAVVAVCFWAGHWFARSKGREALPWALVSALLPGIGLLMLAVQRSKKRIDEDAANEAADQARLVRAVPLQPSHEERWRWLTLNDPDIMSAVERLRPYGQPAQVLLRDIYLPAENKSALNSMVAQVANQARLAIATAQQPQRTAALRASTAQQTDLARYTTRHPAVAHVDPRFNGVGTEIVAQPVRSPPSFEPPLGPSFVNGQETSTNRSNVELALQGRLGSTQSSATAAPFAGTNDSLASATAALASALRNANAAGGLRAEAAAEPQGEAQSRGIPVSVAPRTVPHHTSVVAADLKGASFLETYRSIHLFQLADGRVYVDKYLAVASVDLARQAVDYVAARNDT